MSNSKENERISYIVNIWNRKYSLRRKLELKPFNRQCLSMYCYFFNFSKPPTYENEQIVPILNIWNRKCRSTSRKRKMGLTAFDRKYFDFVLLIFSHNCCYPQSYENEWISHILNIWNWKCRSRSRRRKPELDLRHSIANVLVCIAEFFHNFSIPQHMKTNEFHIF